MISINSFIFLFTIFCSFNFSISQDPIIVCYYTNWAQYRQSLAKFLPESINASLCTHINYAFAKIENDKLEAYEWNDEDIGSTPGMYTRVIKKKNENPNLKILLSVGGWNIGSAVFSSMARNSTKRQIFISSSISLLRKYGFDGLDIDWEYPAARDGYFDDKIYFTLLLKETNIEFSKYNLSLTVALSASPLIIDNGYDIPEIIKYIDFFNLMSYDYYGPWSSIIGHNSPLYNRSNDNSFQNTMNINYSVNYLIKKGAPRNKIVVGVPFYGHTFKLSDNNKTIPGSSSLGSGIAGPYTLEAGSISYFEICSLIQTNEWIRVWDFEQKVPYIYKNDQWISYDDIQSLIKKINYVKTNNLGGVMIWDLDFDDFTGNFCKQGKYPLLSSILNHLTSNETILVTTSQTTSMDSKTTSKLTTTTITTGTKFMSSTTTIRNNIKEICVNGDGLYPDYNSKCKKYYHCVYSSTIHAIAYLMPCPTGLLFDNSLKICNSPIKVNCVKNS